MLVRIILHASIAIMPPPPESANEGIKKASSPLVGIGRSLLASGNTDGGQDSNRAIMTHFSTSAILERKPSKSSHAAEGSPYVETPPPMRVRTKQAWTWARWMWSAPQTWVTMSWPLAVSRQPIFLGSSQQHLFL